MKKATLLLAAALAFGCGNSTLQNLIQNNPLFPPGTTRVSVDSGGNEGNDNSFEPSLSADARFAAFFSDATNLVPNDTNGFEDIFVHDRTTNATGRVCQQSAAQLQRYDAGYRFSRDGGRSFPFRGRGVRIPRLEEVLDLEPRVRVGIEIKPDDPEVARALAELLRRRGEAQRVLVASFHHRVLTAFRQACSEAATSASPWETRQFLVLAMFGQEALFSPAFQALQIPEEHKGRRLLTPSLVAAAHRRGLKVIPWTINQEADMRRLLGWGVDGLNTDYPDRLLKVLPPALR